MAEAEGVVQGVAEVVAVVHREGVGVAVPPARQAALAVKEGLPVGEAVKVPPPPGLKRCFVGGRACCPWRWGGSRRARACLPPWQCRWAWRWRRRWRWRGSRSDCRWA